LLFTDSDFIVMAVGGPNDRHDFHVDPGAEFFYQLEGRMTLRTVQEGRFQDVSIAAGEVFLLPAHVPHSPRRPANTVGIVVERVRQPQERDGFQWYCARCAHLLHEEFVHISNIETQLPPIFARFHEHPERRYCRDCDDASAPLA
jgi:3-hydroxyanthranilate 3,4-dioxygenase